MIGGLDLESIEDALKDVCGQGLDDLATCFVFGAMILADEVGDDGVVLREERGPLF